MLMAHGDYHFLFFRKTEIINLRTWRDIIRVEATLITLHKFMYNNYVCILVRTFNVNFYC